jgi:hypothetical protein
LVKKHAKIFRRLVFWRLVFWRLVKKTCKGFLAFGKKNNIQ